MTGHPAADAVLVAAAVAGALSALWRFLHLGELLAGTRAFLQDWMGEPARPGRDAVEPFPARVAGIERALTRLQTTVDDTEHQLRHHQHEADAQQVVLLREYVEQQLQELTADRLRAESYRAALVELGILVDPIHSAPPPERNT